jgi:hypothetical protein
MIKPLTSLIVIGGLMSSFTALAGHVSDQKATKPPVIATQKAAVGLVHELLDSEYSNVRLTPTGCYEVNVATREDGIYVAHVTERAGKKCSLWTGQGISPFSMEIQPSTGAVTFIDFLGKPRQVYMFQIQDNPDMPTNQEQWRLEGTTKRSADTDQCNLWFGIPAFEAVPAYTFGMDANKDTHVLTVSYSVDMYGGGAPISSATLAGLSLLTEKERLASYAATLQPMRLNEGNVRTTNDVLFKLTLNEHEAQTFLDAFAHATRVTPSLDQQDQSNLALRVDGGFTRDFNTQVNAKVVTAFRRCLDVIWK